MKKTSTFASVLISGLILLAATGLTNCKKDETNKTTSTTSSTGGAGTTTSSTSSTSNTGTTLADVPNGSN